ncbi:hypothetical protein ACHAWT_002578 [Skeletonema menzelii]
MTTYATTRRRSTSPSTVQQPHHPPHQFTFAKRTLRKLVEDSTFFKALEDENNVGTIHERDVAVGHLLGSGGFCEVRVCAAAKKKKNDDNDTDELKEQRETDAASKSLYENPSSKEEAPPQSDNIQKYAIKYLSPTRTAPHSSDPKNKVFQRGIADLAVEACFLSLLRHENIISCHYVSQGSLEENFNANSCNDSAGGDGDTKKKKKKKYREEIVSDSMGNLSLKRVPVEEDGEDENAVQNQQQKQAGEEVYKHRFGYFLLLDVLHETLAHRIDYVYIPQVLLSSNDNGSSFVLSSDLTESLLYTHEKRDSFLKRMTSKRTSLFPKQSNSNTSVAISSSSHSAPGIRSLTHPKSSSSGGCSGDQLQRSHHDIVYDQKQKLAQRLTSLLAIGNALQYLHEHRILFRDIKPDNIGFYRDYSGPCTCGAAKGGGDGKDCTCFVEIPKLFDFGLAKELKAKYRVKDGHQRLDRNSRDYSEKKEYAHHDKGGLLRKSMSIKASKSTRLCDDDVYRLTGCTGSRRYMAPEVCFHDPYNEKADVYSFGMMLYQVASLVTPFDGYSSYDHEKEVLRGGFRPDIALPTKKDFLICKRLDEIMFDEIDNGKVLPDDDIHPGLPAPSAKRNEVLAIKSKSVWTKDLKRLVDECWDYDMRYRPTMKEVVERLQGCIDELSLPSQQMQQQKKGRDSLEERPDVTRGSRNHTTTANGLHRQGGNQGGECAVEIRSNFSNDISRGESIKKNSAFFRSSWVEGNDEAAAVAGIQQ